MGAQRDQAPHPPMVVTNRGDRSWRSQGKRYPLKERQRIQWGGYGKQYGAGGKRRSYPTYRTDRTQTQSYNTAYESQRQGSYFPTKSIGNKQGGNGGSEDGNDKKKYRDTRINHENDSHEESDTEDSYEFEITSQQLSQVTPGGGALKIKLSKKKPLKITAGAPDGQSETIPMELERIQSPRRSVPSSHVDTTSESTLPTRRAGAPLFITPIQPEKNERPQEGISTKGANDLQGSTNYGLTKERVTQVQGSDTREVKGQLETEIHRETEVEETLLEEPVGIRDFQVKEGALPEEMVIREEEEVMMILTLVMMGMEMILLPPQTPLPQGKENIRVPNMFMYFKDPLDQKVKKVNLDKQEEMVEMGRIFP